MTKRKALPFPVVKQHRVGGSGVTMSPTQVVNAAIQMDRAARVIQKAWRSSKSSSKSRKYVPRRTLAKVIRDDDNKINQISQHNDVSAEKFQLVLRKKPVQGTRDKIKYNENQSYVLSAGEGTQGVFEPKIYLGLNQFVGTVSSARNTQNAMPYLWFNLNPNSNLTGSLNLGGDQIADSRRINIHKFHTSMEFVNMEQANTTVWVYFFTPKKVMAQTPATVWSNGLGHEWQNQLTRGVASVTTTASTAVGGPQTNDVGQFPNVRELTRTYRLLKCKKFVLQGGDTHKLEFETYVNKVVEYGTLKDMYDNGAKYIAGLTVIPLVLAKGALCAISDAGGPQEITYSTVKLGVVQASKYTLSAPKEPPSAPIQFQKDDLVRGSHDEFIYNDIDAQQKIIPL